MDIASLQPWIGRQQQRVDYITSRTLAQFSATLAPHIFQPEAHSAPPAFHWTLAQEASAMATIAEDGHPQKGEFLPPVPLPRRMWAGGSVETFAPLNVNDEVTRTSVIEDIQYKQGKSGDLLFVTVVHDFTTQGVLAVRDRQNIVYRPAANTTDAGPSATTTETNTTADHYTVTITPVLLFRYSAITFNSHRIHYDHPYTTEQEGYAGLVVHGPLQATLLLNFMAQQAGRCPNLFRYRGTQPLTVNDQIDVRLSQHTLSAQETHASLRNGQGQVTMQASALFT